MAIILNGEVHDLNKMAVEATPRPVLGLEPIEPEKEQLNVDQNHHIVVNGTKKKLGVKSSYLLDLLTIE
jgi:hypothetical protein